MTNQPMIGDAPKEFLRVYEYGTGFRRNIASWPAYIAKVGHKWYPVESVTEQLITRVGECCGITVAESRLMHHSGQIRFLSRYFLGPDQSLVHGAEILAGYLEDDEFVREVGKERGESQLFTFQVLKTAIVTRFPEEQDEIMRDFVRMIAFDALVGNQDRHLYNWGVVVHAKGVHRPYFSPIFDTARGLFWNTAESGLTRFGGARLERYVLSGHPLIGWDGETGLNHFQLLDRVKKHSAAAKSALDELNLELSLRHIGMVIDKEFVDLLSLERRTLIKKCLVMRFEMVQKIVEG